MENLHPPILYYNAYMMESEYHYQTEKKDARGTASHAIIPLTIKQVKALTKDNEIDHQEFQHVVVVGKLQSANLQGNKYRVILNDGTGNLELTSLTGGEKKGSSLGENLGSRVGRYFFAVCTPKLKKENGEWIYYLDNIRELQDHNELTKHLSDIILAHLERTH